jgi:hypothetical protein
MRGLRPLKVAFAIASSAWLAAGAARAASPIYSVTAVADGAPVGDLVQSTGGAGGTPGIFSVSAQSGDLAALAAADLPSGALRASASGATWVGATVVEGSASFTDRVTVIVPPGWSSASFPVTVALDVTGSIVPGGASDGARILATLGVDVLSGNVQYCAASGGFVDTFCGGAIDNDPHLTRTFDLSTASPGFTLTGTLQASAYGDAVADASNTAQLGVALPDGFGFGSDSGVLLTAPEPASSAMLAAVLGALAILRVRAA